MSMKNRFIIAFLLLVLGIVTILGIESFGYEEVVESNPCNESFVGPMKLHDDHEVDIIAKTLYGECRGVPSTKEKAAVVWVVLNRVDAGYGSITRVCTAPYQFVGYNSSHPVTEELRWITEDVLYRWYREKAGDTSVGRVLPSDYLWFTGNGVHNFFRNSFYSRNYWDWSLGDVYGS